jgi:putative transposase
MPDYRRLYLPGGMFFFTVNLADRREQLLTRHVHLLRLAFAETRRALPFGIEAIVVLPEHLHCIWKLPPCDSDFPTRWRLIKAGFSRRMCLNEDVSGSRAARCERGVWQRRFWEHAIRDEADYSAHLDYIHYNPVKHGHTVKVVDWPYSSFHRFLRAGLYPANWAVAAEPSGSFGEAR